MFLVKARQVAMMASRRSTTSMVQVQQLAIRSFATSKSFVSIRSVLRSIGFLSHFTADDYFLSPSFL